MALVLLGTQIISCTVPTATDFESEKKPLGEDEVIVIWRMSKEVSATEALDFAPEDTLKARQWVDPLFEQVIPRIFSDIKTGNITLYNPEDHLQLETPLEDLDAWMAEADGASWQNLGPMLEVFHLTQRRKQSDQGLGSKALYLSLVLKTPNSSRPERIFGHVSLVDLAKLNYGVEIAGNTLPLMDYLDGEARYKWYPINITNVDDKPGGLYTLHEAFYHKDLLLTGRWGEFDVNNYSGLTAIPMNQEIKDNFVGAYELGPEVEKFWGPQDGPVTLLVKETESGLKIELSIGWIDQLVQASQPTQLFDPYGWTLEKTEAGVVLQNTYLFPDRGRMLGQREEE